MGNFRFVICPESGDFLITKRVSEPHRNDIREPGGVADMASSEMHAISEVAQ
jgi:hypothetical protein